MCADPIHGCNGHYYSFWRINSRYESLECCKKFLISVAISTKTQQFNESGVELFHHNKDSDNKKIFEYVIKEEQSKKVFKLSISN